MDFDNDFLFSLIERELKIQRESLIEYIDSSFSAEEQNRHYISIMQLISSPELLIAKLKIELLTKENNV